MSPALKALPEYLRKYTAEQKYDAYTSRDHAAWRYIMRQNRAFFSKHAVSVYLEGLKKTGISLDRIPRISEMDELLSQFGWGAVPVRGFIPPAAFLDFQARAVLPIACDMRSVNHIAYTPAPDIVHEAAGHAPIIAEPAYARYLHRYAQMAQRAIQSAEDIRQYEAIRYLSDIKENPDTPPATIAQAEARLKEVSAQISHVSEAAKVARMAWWTVEYGLMGETNAPRIYGAGLLSSVGESQNCLSDKVRKIPLTVNCVEQSYDITEPQPQLFVTPDMDHLEQVLTDLEMTMAFRLGGEEGMARAKKAASVNTTVLDSGLEVSGQVVEYTKDDRGELKFFKCSGPVQLAFDGTEIRGQGRARHGHGFSSPIGHWKNAPGKPQKSLSDDELARLGLKRGDRAELHFTSGIVVKGKIAGWHREQGNLVFVTWTDCTVTDGSRVLFEPSWGEFDMAVGEKITSVFGGPADRIHYGDLDIGNATTTPARSTPYTSEEKHLFEIYQKIRGTRETKQAITADALMPIAQDILRGFSDEWLLSLEVLEILRQKIGRAPAEFSWSKELEENLREKTRTADDTTRELVTKGLTLVSVTD